MFCMNCGKKVGSAIKFCPDCGARMIEASTPASDARGTDAGPVDRGLNPAATSGSLGVAATPGSSVRETGDPGYGYRTTPDGNGKDIVSGDSGSGQVVSAKKRSRIPIFIGIAAACVVCVVIVIAITLPVYHYKQAEEAYVNGDFWKAADEFKAAGNHKDAPIFEEKANILLSVVEDGFGEWRGEPIIWRILDVEDERALLISEDALAVRQYDALSGYGWLKFIYNGIDDPNVKMTWAESDIRSWLNDDFLNMAFSKNEQKSILLSEIRNPDNEEFGTDGGMRTEDKVFLLSIDEYNQYFDQYSRHPAALKLAKDDIDYITGIREENLPSSQIGMFAEDEFELQNEENLNQKLMVDWWLRSPGQNSTEATFIYWTGIGIGSCPVAIYHYGVHSAIWINLEV